MTEFLNTYGTYILFIGGITIIGIIVTIINYKKMKNNVADFLTKNPNAAKICLTTKAFITSEAVTVHTVNGETPILFSEKGKTGVYAIPGDIEIEMSYSYTRPGVMYKTVTTSTDVVKKNLQVEENKTYILGFDRKKQQFTFEELEEK